MAIRTILWDVDGTLLDFKAAEKVAARALFARFELGPCTNEMIERYSAVNDAWWKRLERGEATKPQVLVERFREFFSAEGIDPGLAEQFNHEYQYELGETAICRDDSYALVDWLRGVVCQYVVSNGTVIAQTRKLSRSGLGNLMDGIFLSEDLGVEKPSPVFFEKVFEKIGTVDHDEILIVGDSLTSDIQGGINAGIRTCWYNPADTPAPDGMRIDHTIANLHEVPALL